MLNLKLILLLCLCVVVNLELEAQSRLNVDSVGNYKFVNPSVVNTNEVWGHVDSNGTEYALVGRGNGFSVISLQNPESPDLIYSDTSAISLWRDIKTWNGYAYVVNEDRFGLEIYDLNNLPGAVRKVGSFTGDSLPLQKAHNLWIDSNGVAYIFGTNNRLPNSVGTIFLDLYTDPENPRELGKYDSLYIHDGYVRDDILYAGAVNDGKMIILDVSNKQNPRLIGSITTPSSFTHNTWLSDDGNTVFTTDEVSGAYIAAYDVSNPATPFERDRIRTRNTTEVIPHNTHVWNDFLITSYYTAGVSIVDASNPDILVEVGYFDTSPDFSGNGFNGNWGAYPFLPSGLILATDMQEGLFVLRPNYQRASFLEVFVNDCEGNRLSQARVILDTSDTTLTNLAGKAEFGSMRDGYYSLSIDAKGFIPVRLDSVELRPGATERISVLLQDSASGLVSQLIDNNQRKLNGIVVRVENTDTSSSVISSSNGIASFRQLEYGTYDIRIGAWGYENKCYSSVAYDCNNDTNIYLLERKVEDFFEVDQGWMVSGNEVDGAWTIGEPIGTVDRFFVANPGADVGSDCGRKAMLTGNGTGSVDRYEVDETTILRSPAFELDAFIEPYLVFYTWFYNGGDQPNDQMHISLIDTAGNRIYIDTIAERGQSASWKLNNIKVSDFMEKGELAHIEFEVTDRGAKHILEAGIDHFFVSEGEYIGVEELEKAEAINIYPNPFDNEVYISSDKGLSGRIELFDASMRVIKSEQFNSSTRLVIPLRSKSGLYFIRISTNEGAVFTKKLVKR